MSDHVMPGQFSARQVSEHLQVPCHATYVRACVSDAQADASEHLQCRLVLLGPDFIRMFSRQRVQVSTRIERNEALRKGGKKEQTEQNKCLFEKTLGKFRQSHAVNISDNGAQGTDDF